MPMKELLRKSIQLLRSHPLLWAPYVVAELIVDGISRLRHLADARILLWESSRQIESVFGGNFSPRAFDTNAIEVVYRLRTSLAWAADYAERCIFTAAMVFTMTMVSALVRKEQPVIATATARLRQYPKRILLYSAQAWLLSAILFVLIEWPIYLPGFRSAMTGHASDILSRFLDLIGGLCFAWFMAPIAVRLLRPVAEPDSTRDEKRLSRAAFLLTAVAYVVLIAILNPLVMKLNLSSAGEINAAFRLAALIANSPYVVLYVAFSLIADARLRAEVASGPSWTPKLRGLLRSVMPLHFQPPSEP